MVQSPKKTVELIRAQPRPMPFFLAIHIQSATATIPTTIVLTISALATESIWLMVTLPSARLAVFAEISSLFRLNELATEMSRETALTAAPTYMAWAARLTGSGALGSVRKTAASLPPGMDDLNMGCP